MSGIFMIVQYFAGGMIGGVLKACWNSEVWRFLHFSWLLLLLSVFSRILIFSQEFFAGTSSAFAALSRISDSPCPSRLRLECSPFPMRFAATQLPPRIFAHTPASLAGVTPVIVSAFHCAYGHRACHRVFPTRFQCATRRFPRSSPYIKPVAPACASSSAITLFYGRVF